MTFTPVRREFADAAEAFKRLVPPYAAELDAHADRATPPEIIEKWAQSMVDIRDDDRFLVLCHAGDALVGFVYGKIDRPHHRGFVRPGDGDVLELYVLPEHRRRGFGSAIYARLERFFRENGAKSACLTADPVTGRPFWLAMGYAPTGTFSEENGLEFFEKML